MKKCPSCGADLPDDAVFCNICGTQVSESLGGQTENPSAPVFEKTDNLYRGSDSSVRNDDTEETERFLYKGQTKSGGSGNEPPVPPEPPMKNPKQNRGFHFGWIFIIAEAAAILIVCFLIFRANSKNQIIDTTSWNTSTADTKSGTESEKTVSGQTSGEAGNSDGTGQASASSAASTAVLTPSAAPTPNVTPVPTASVTDAEPTDLGNYQQVSVGSASASSELHQAKIQYNNAPIKAADNDPITSWQEGSAGDGIGEWLSFQLSGKSKIEYIDCKLGNWRDDYYAKNNRPKKMTLNIGGQSYSLEFTDAQIDHYIVFSTPIPASDAKFTIDSVYPGTNADCCVAEITFYSSN